MVGYIYCISNTVNNKLYVGKTVNSIEERFREHLSDAQRKRCENRPLYRAINKYGSDKFSISILEQVEISLLAEREIYWIEKLGTYEHGYNATLGGDGKILYGDDVTELFISDYNHGMNMLEIAAKHNCSVDIVSNRLQMACVDTKLNALNQSKHAVRQYDLHGNLIRTFESCRAAARHLIEQGSTATLTTITTNIGRVLNGKRKTCEGYRWELA